MDREQRALGMSQFFRVVVVILRLQAHIAARKPSQVGERVSVRPPHRVIHTKRCVGL